MIILLHILSSKWKKGWDYDDWMHNQELCGTSRSADHFYQGSDTYYAQVGGHGIYIYFFNIS